MKFTKSFNPIKRPFRTSGIVTIEFIFGFMILFYCLMFWVELCIIGFLSSVVDYAISESSRTAKASANANYTTIFYDAINNSENAWTKIIDVDKFDVSVEYFSTFQDVANGIGSSSGTNKPIALYKVSYDYEPMFPAFFESDYLALSREVYAIQEFERDQFSQ